MNPPPVAVFPLLVIVARRFTTLSSVADVGVTPEAVRFGPCTPVTVTVSSSVPVPPVPVQDTE